MKGLTRDPTAIYCGTDWRHCPQAPNCPNNFEDSRECERKLRFPMSKMLDVKVMEDIDLAHPASGMKLIVDHGKFRLFRTPRTDRDLLLAYEREYSRCERSRIAGTALTLLASMLTGRGYSTDIHDVRKRLF